MNKFPLVALIAVVLVGCSDPSKDTFTLYRNSPTDENMRLHIATFDANENNNYNAKNCDMAAGFFQSQPVRTRFWCEKGTFKK